jgi:hypothetical protein
VPSLQIDVEARVAKFQDSLDALSRDVTRQVRGMERAFGALGSAFGGVAAVLGAGAIGTAIVQTINSMADLDDAAIQTGASVESLSSLLNTLSPTGVTLDQISDIASKLAKSMAEAQTESSRAAEAFKALGVSTVDSNGNLRAVDDTLVDVARALGQYSDGTNKVVIAQALLSKSGASYLTVLKDLAEFQRVGPSLTTDQAAAAGDLADQFGRLISQTKALAQELAGPIVIRLNELIEQFRVGNVAAGGFGAALAKFGLNFQSPEANLERIGNRIAELNQQIAKDSALAEGAGSAFGRGARTAAQARVAAAKEQIAALEKEAVFFRLLQEQAARGGAGPAAPPQRPPAPGLRTGEDDKTKTARKEQISDGERLVRNLEDQVLSTLQLTQVQRLQSDIARGRIQFDSEAQRIAALNAAEQIDSIKRIADASDSESAAAIRRIRNYEELNEAQGRVNEASEQAIAAQIQGFRDLADPTLAYQRDLERIGELLRENLITAAEADVFRQSSTERLLGTFDAQGDAAKDLDKAVRDLGFTFSSAFEDAVLDGNKLSDVLKGLAKDVARIFLRQTVTGPLAESLSGFATGLFGGGASVTGNPFEMPISKAVPASATPTTLSFDLSNSALTKDFIAGVVGQSVAAARGDRLETTFRGKGF